MDNKRRQQVLKIMTGNDEDEIENLVCGLLQEAVNKIGKATCPVADVELPFVIAALKIHAEELERIDKDAAEFAKCLMDIKRVSIRIRGKGA